MQTNIPVLWYADERIHCTPGPPPEYPPGLKLCPCCGYSLRKQRFSSIHQDAEEYIAARYCLQCGWWDFAHDVWGTTQSDDFDYHRGDIEKIRSVGY
jgi:hypothetical protein